MKLVCALLWHVIECLYVIATNVHVCIRDLREPVNELTSRGDTILYSSPIRTIRKVINGRSNLAVTAVVSG